MGAEKTPRIFPDLKLRRLTMQVTALYLLCPSTNVEASIAKSISNILKSLGKPAVAISTSALGGFISAKVMKDLERAHDNSPRLHVATYFFLFGTNRKDDAIAFWEAYPRAHFDFMKTVDSLDILDMDEINRTSEKADVLVSLSVKQFGRKPANWRD